MIILLLGYLVAAEQTSSLPDLAEIFMENRRDALARVLPDNVRIEVQMKPLLEDHGRLSHHQVLMCFDKLQSRYLVVESDITNTQSDTNYAWLEVYLDLTLEDRASGLRYFATLAFHYKIIGARIAVERMVLQDLH